MGTYIMQFEINSENEYKTLIQIRRFEGLAFKRTRNTI